MKLILFNGPAGVGKTTVANMLHKEMPLSFLLDLDRQRDFISDWQCNRLEVRSFSFDLALALAEVTLKRGHDFICSKAFLDYIDGNREMNILDSFIDLGHQYGADVYEIFLWAEKSVSMNRAQNRGYEIKPTHTPENDAEVWEQMKELKSRRDKAIVINTDDLSAEAVLNEVKAAIDLG